MDDLATEPAEQSADEEIGCSWAVIMLARTVQTAAAICVGQPVIARNLDPAALRRALRGAPLPDPSEYVTITIPMLEAIDEAGPFATVK